MQDQVNNGGPAFPFVAHENWRVKCEGMTLRDYFAAKAMAAIIVANDASESVHTLGAAIDAYNIADYMLKARGAQ